MNDLIGVTAAARELGCNHSTVSRYVKSNPELNHGSDKRPKVNLAELREHREETVNVAKSGSHAGRLLGEESDQSDSDSGPGERKLTYSHAKATREAIGAQNARIDLDEKLGRLVPRAEVEAIAYDAGQMLQGDLLELGQQLAERLVAMNDAREIAALIESEHRRVLAKLASALRDEGDAVAAA